MGDKIEKFVDRAVLVGVSDGARRALGFAHRHPERVSRARGLPGYRARPAREDPLHGDHHSDQCPRGRARLQGNPTVGPGGSSTTLPTRVWLSSPRPTTSRCSRRRNNSNDSFVRLCQRCDSRRHGV